MSFRDVLPPLTSLPLIVLLGAACSAPTPAPPTEGGPAASTATPAPEPDYWPTEGWRTSTPEEQGMDSEILEDMLATIRERDQAVESILVIRNGYLVLEVYHHPFSRGTKHMIQSCTKSIVSALVGMAIEKGSIESVEQSVLGFFPERSVAHRDASKEAMTLEHLLTMTSGFECSDSDGAVEMRASDDWVQYVLDLPMADEPGTRFRYCNGVSFLLSAILQQTTGMTARSFADQHLLGPLGISDIGWKASPHGITIGYAELEMLPLDMAKIGYLYLHQGMWDGDRILPAAWVETSARKHVATGEPVKGYGYQWWVDSPGILGRLGWFDDPQVYTAVGYGGQYIAVVPERNMVVVFTSALGGRGFLIPLKLLNSAIIPAAGSSVPLPPNPEGLARLESRITELERPGKPEPIPPFPEMAQEVSGKTYRMAANSVQWKDFSLRFREQDAMLRMVFNIRKECPVGLDGVFRVGATESGRGLACKGHWSSDDTFAVRFLELGNSQSYDVAFTFEGDEVSVVVRESSSGRSELKFSGKRES